MSARRLLFFIFCLCPFFSFAQGERNIWYFGTNAGLDFSGGAPVGITDGQLVSTQGSASICDPAGNLLFYTDGATIWNQAHGVMVNGTGLMGNESSTQGSVIVPFPSSDTLFYVFTTPASGSGELYFSIVDISLQGGQGEVIAKNIMLSPGSKVTEYVTAATHADGCSVWIIAHEYPEKGNFSDAYHAYLLDSTGITTTPVISNTGTLFANTGSRFTGCIKASQDNSKLAITTYDNRTFEMSDFNNATGVVSNTIKSERIFFQAYGVEFSPDGNRLYGTYFTSLGMAGYASLVQFDISNATDSLKVHMEVGKYTGPSGSISTVQIGPDDKIYVSRNNFFAPSAALGVINNPNALGLACNYDEEGVDLAGRDCRMGLPHFYNKFCYTPPADVLSATLSFVPPKCNGESTGTVSVIATGGNPNYTYSWSPVAGSDSVLNNVPAGTYVVTITDQDNNTLIDSITVTDPTALSITPLSDATICVGDSATFTATVNGGTPNYTYSWDGGAGTSSSYTASPTVTTDYVLQVSDSNNCTTSDTVSVIVVPSITAQVNGDTTICDGDSVTLSASGGTDYTWSTSDNTQSITVSPSTTTTYTVTVTSGSCAPDQATVTVSIGTPPSISISGDSVICPGASTTLTASGGTQYQWDNGPATASISVSPSADTTLTLQATAGGCWTTKTVSITMKAPPTVSITGITEVCNGDQTTLTASGGTTYQWSTGDNVASTTITPSSDTTITVSVSDGNCTTLDSVTVQVVTPPTLDAGPDQLICTGDNITLSPTTDATAYQWNTGETTLNINVAPTTTTTYTITVTKGTCTPASDEVTVQVVTALTVDAGNDTTICLGDSAHLYAVGGSSFSWSHGASTQSTAVAPSTTTTYTVTGSSGSCPDDDDEVVVNVTQAIADAGTDQTITTGQSITLNGAGGTTYLWSPDTDLDDPNSATPTATPSVTTTYTLTITDQNGCVATDEVTIYTEDICGEVYLPNAFSPNGDGQNDVLYVRGCLQSVYLVIFDRWGEKVFETTDQGQGWDGYYENKEGAIAVFDYYLEATTDKGEQVTQNGTIHLIR